ncbi:MAG TPA: SRPBCC family protein [Pseudonocardiaceae bacterium]|jgi:uncharacterized protein YndB with AHSA1/START domain|nr:SRPBCC family protein [Pseudonocardiaceae bacterium]
MDIVGQINQIHREVGTGRIPAGDGRTVLLRRDFDAPIDDVWDACTDADRISRWFLPVTGDLRLGGTYQLEGNAGGEILRCEPPRLLRVSWIFGELPPTEVEVRLTGADDRTVFELEHVAIVDPAMWEQFGPGAVGIGWDLTLIGLTAHLSGASTQIPKDWQRTPAALEFITRSGEAWGVAYQKSGATADEAEATTRTTIAAYTTPPA